MALNEQAGGVYGKKTTAPYVGSATRALPSETYVKQALPPILGTIDLTTMYIAAIFFIGNAALAAAGGVVSLTYLFIGGLFFFLPCVIATAQLAALYPHEGSLYNWTYRTLGGYWGFFAGTSYWLPNVLAVVGAADGFVTYIQGLNPHWLVEPWQQGLAILGVIAFTAILGLQRQRITQNVVNVVIGLLLCVVLLLALSCIVFLAQHNSMTPLNHVGDWLPNGSNFSLFGLIALLYLGTSIPLNMGGELRPGTRPLRHLLWGTLIVLLSYFISTFALLAVRGPALVNNPIIPYEVVVLLDSMLGHVIGTIAAVCILGFYLISALVYNYANSRLILAASIDMRLPVVLGRLNKYRIPTTALLLQSLLAAGLVGIIFFLVPSLTILGKPANLAIETYNIVLAAMTTIWALTTIFYFVDVVAAYLRDRVTFRQKRAFPFWLLWLSIPIGTITCLVIVLDTFQNSWTPLIPNNVWWFSVGCVVLFSIVITAIGSMFASSQVDWESFHQSSQTDTIN